MFHNSFLKELNKACPSPLEKGWDEATVNKQIFEIPVSEYFA